MKKEKPLIRHQALVPYSRDHHAGLMFILHIRKGFKKIISSERISRYILFFFKEDLKKHFRDQELKLFPMLPADDPLRIQAETEHAKIYWQIEKIKAGIADISLLTQFSDDLESHIRFEERILFPYLQEQISLTGLVHTLSRDKNILCDVSSQWNDPFWQQELK